MDIVKVLTRAKEDGLLYSKHPNTILLGSKIWMCEAWDTRLEKYSTTKIVNDINIHIFDEYFEYNDAFTIYSLLANQKGLSINKLKLIDFIWAEFWWNREDECNIKKTPELMDKVLTDIFGII